MGKNVYVPSMDGIPGIMPGTETVLPKPVEIAFSDFMPDFEKLQKPCSVSRRANLNMRMKPSDKKSVDYPLN